jgi:flagellar biosynthesis protein FliP
MKYVLILLLGLAVIAATVIGAGDALAQTAAKPLATAPAATPGVNSILSGGSEGSVTSRIVQTAAVLTLISVAPALLIMVTSFTRFLIAFSFLRSGLGLQGAPANLVLIALALFMTFYVMAPTFDRAWQEGGRPLLENRIDEQKALALVIAPFEEFMRANVREKDLRLFEELAVEKIKMKDDVGAKALRVLIPAYIVSELRRGFEIGFLILLPFLVIDLIVATLVMSMGMMMLSPTVFSLPCKVMFFVLIDGWHLLVGGLVRSFA